MSDYLNHLVARNLQPIEAIQPRLPSRFEPPSLKGLGNVFPSPTNSPEVEELIEEVEVQPPPVQPSSQKEIGRKFIERSPVTERLETPAALQMESTSPQASIIPPPQQPQVTPSEVKDSSHPNHSPSNIGEEATPTDSLPIKPSRLIHAKTDETTSTASTKTVESQTPIEPAIEQQAREKAHPLVPAPPDPLEVRTTPQPAIVPQAEVKRAIAPQPAAMTAAPSSVVPKQNISVPLVQPEVKSLSQPTLVIKESLNPTPPTIQVTIGRIEVRAMPPAIPQTPKPTPQTTVMSLEEYMRSTGRGGKS